MVIIFEPNSQDGPAACMRRLHLANRRVLLLLRPASEGGRSRIGRPGRAIHRVETTLNGGTRSDSVTYLYHISPERALRNKDFGSGSSPGGALGKVALWRATSVAGKFLGSYRSDSPRIGRRSSGQIRCLASIP